MALVMPPLVQETTTTTGTGTYTLSGSAPTGRQTFANAAADGQITTGDQVYYMVIDATGGPPDFEHGIGTWTSAGNTLTRDVILSSSNAGSAVSWGVGTRTVYVVGPQPAERPVRTSVRRSTDQSIGAGANVAISWDTENEDSAGAWAVSPNPTRITVPTGYTRMRIVGQVTWAAVAEAKTLRLELWLNGAPFSESPRLSTVPESSVGAYQNITSEDLIVAAGQFFELGVANTGSLARNISGTGQTFFAATFWRE